MNQLFSLCMPEFVAGREFMIQVEIILKWSNKKNPFTSKSVNQSVLASHLWPSGRKGFSKLLETGPDCVNL